MLEIKIQLSATDELIAAMRNLATAFANDGKTPDPTAPVNTTPIDALVNPTTALGTQPTATPAAMPTIVETTAAPTAPVNPTPAPVATPAQAPGAPLSATPAQTATPIAPTVPVAAPVPAAAPAANAAPAPAVPTSAPQYTLDMIATAGSALIDAGKMDQLMGLLGKFGVASLTELAPESYGAVANELRAMGAAI